MRVPGLLLAVALLSAPSCSQLVQYTDELTDKRTGRTLFVRAPATLGGVVGFVVGIPVDIVALPITYAVYAYQDANEPGGTDPLSILLFPSFFLWRAGSLIAAPFDMIEFAVYRAWRSPETLTREEREEIEFYHDDHVLPTYPVTPIYPEGGQ